MEKYNVNHWFAGIIGISLLLTTSCNTPTKNADGEVQDSTALADTIGSIGVNPLTHAKEFPDAVLRIGSLTSQLVDDSAEVTINYEIENFKLTEQTEHDHQMANAAEGQHIHFILDNEPYVALYKPDHSFKVALGSEHILMSFLSRSFHESIKTDPAYRLVKFKVDHNGKIEQLDLPTEPTLLYSRPKGEYHGSDTKALLLDFYLVNTTLEASGHQIKAEINDQEFILTQWAPYELLNLPMGENRIKLTLIDEDGNPLKGDNTSVERKFNLYEN